MRKNEKEPVFRFNSAERVLRIYSCHPSLWRRVEKKGFTPTNRHFQEGVEIARQYRVPLDCFRYGFRDPNRRRRPGAARSPPCGHPVRTRVNGVHHLHQKGEAPMASRKAAAPKHNDTPDQDDDREIINFRDLLFRDLLDDPSLSRAPSFLDIHIEDGEELETRPCEIRDAMICAWRSAQEAREHYTEVGDDFLETFACSLARAFSTEVAEYLDQFPDKYRVAVAQFVVEGFFRAQLLSMADSDDAEDE